MMSYTSEFLTCTQINTEIFKLINIFHVYNIYINSYKTK